MHVPRINSWVRRLTLDLGGAGVVGITLGPLRGLLSQRPLMCYPGLRSAASELVPLRGTNSSAAELNPCLLGGWSASGGAQYWAIVMPGSSQPKSGVVQVGWPPTLDPAYLTRMSRAASYRPGFTRGGAMPLVESNPGLLRRRLPTQTIAVKCVWSFMDLRQF